MSNASKFRFVDLFAGIGGFHAAMKAYGGECVYAVELDSKAARVYEANWGHSALGDITEDADHDLGIMNVPAHDVLCAGFPCQPFSKSGAQRGMDEARGTLFFNIASIIRAHHPTVVLLENVRNLIGPRHEHEWDVIIETLREEGYHVADRPAVFSPHLLPPRLGGGPQVRERVFITATYAPDQVASDVESGGPLPVATMSDRFARDSDGDVFDPKRDWNLEDLLDDSHNIPGCDLTKTERVWIDAWDEFVKIMRPRMGDRHLPGHPIWADSWLDFPDLNSIVKRQGNRTGRDLPTEMTVPGRLTIPEIPGDLPAWKQSHLRKNYDMFARHYEAIIPWALRHRVYTEAFPASRRKLEWQAQDTKSLWDTVMHFRPSGIRAKRPTYLPALVAITQTSIVGPRERRLSPRETARLQGLPDSFVFPNQSSAATYKQMGNGVHVGAVWHILRRHIQRDRDLLQDSEAGRRLIDALECAPESPRAILDDHRPLDGITDPIAHGR